MSEEVVIGVLALQGAFEEHQSCLESADADGDPSLPMVRTVQVRTPAQLEGLSGIVLPGGESTSMGLIGAQDGMWDALTKFVQSGKPTWGTCAGMVLLAERCVGGSAVIENGQSLIGGLDILVCRNYFGSQISSFEMATPCPPKSDLATADAAAADAAAADTSDYPGIFIRAPAILNVGPGVKILGKVDATPSRQAAVVLRELERKIDAGEDVVNMGVVDALVRSTGQDGAQGIGYIEVKKDEAGAISATEEKKDAAERPHNLTLPGAADGTNAREVICAVRKDNLLCTAFHPELTRDHRWHSYFNDMVKASLR